MKKLVIVAIASLFAAVVNAASCTWSTMAVTSDMSGMIDGGTYWLVSLGADSGASADFTIFAGGSYDFGTYNVVSTGDVSNGSAGGLLDNLNESDNGTYYALVVWDGVTDGDSYYGVAEGSISGIVINPPSDADYLAFDNLGYGGYMATDTAVTDVVPEPTSGLLMLLGLAGLALKRKHS